MNEESNISDLERSSAIAQWRSVRLSIERLGVRSTAAEWIAVDLLGQERSPQPPWQEAGFRLRSATNYRHLKIKKRSFEKFVWDNRASRHRWADCHMLRSRPSPEFLKLSPRPNIVQNIFKIWSPNSVQKINTVFRTKNAAIFHQLLPNTKKFVIVQIQCSYLPTVWSSRCVYAFCPKTCSHVTRATFLFVDRVTTCSTCSSTARTWTTCISTTTSTWSRSRHSRPRNERSRASATLSICAERYCASPSWWSTATCSTGSGTWTRFRSVSRFFADGEGNPVCCGFLSRRSLGRSYFARRVASGVTDGEAGGDASLLGSLM